MTAASSPCHLISLTDVAGRRVWCPFSGSRVQAPGDSFAANSCCIGPRCAGWTWRSLDDISGSERRRRHLVPPHFSPGYRVRLASRTLPALLEPLTTLAGGAGDPEAARAAILAWAGDNWQPERELAEPESWQRLAGPSWDADADTVFVDLIRTRTDDQRFGVCGLKQTGRTDVPAGAAGAGPESLPSPMT